VIHPTEAVPGLVGANAGPLHGRLAAPTTGEQ